MKIERIELSLLYLPYVHFFETSFGREEGRTFILVRVFADGLCGWGEVVAAQAPLYSYETTETAWSILKEFLVPTVFAHGIVEPDDFERRARRFRGHPMAKAGLELALWDLKAKKAGISLSELYGGTQSEVPSGVSVGIEDTLGGLVEQIGGYLDAGYRRIKIKIKPQWDLEACRAVRKEFPGIVLQVDANGAYRLEDTPVLRALDDFGLLMIEQPFAPHDLWDHSRLQPQLKTSLCLDESILDAWTARQALEMGSCRIVNIKVGRVGGMVEARAIHDLCQAKGVPVWCGGMLESGIGRAHNLHLASLPNFKLPHDLSASNRYYREDLIDPPVELTPGGSITVPTGPGIGVLPHLARIERATRRHEVLRSS